MIFKEQKTIHKILQSLFETYSKRVPDVKKITNALIKKTSLTVNMTLLMTTLHFVPWELKILV